MKISCIIPAYNEEHRIKHVLDAAVGHPLLDEVIVVDDGSTDNTKAVIESYGGGVKFILHPKNRGKSRAIMAGFEAAKNDYIMMLDSDLTGMRPENITALLEPVANGKADMSISLRKNSLPPYRFFGLDYVSGERVFDKKIIPNLEHLGTIPGYGLETYLNDLAIEKQLRIAVVHWDNVIHTMKAKKVGFWKGNWQELAMTLEIFKFLPPHKIVRQFLRMRRLMTHS